MSIGIKICGLNREADIEAVNAAQADFAGFVFFEKSPRHLAFSDAANLATKLAASVKSVALMVNPQDAEINNLLEVFQPDYLQLHGHETPARVSAIKAQTGLPIIKALGVATADDLKQATDFAPLVDILLFDAKPPANADVPGGRGKTFDWDILANYQNQAGATSWMLSGGLTIDNVQEALARTGTKMLDVSSGVEQLPGQKDAAKILEFCRLARENAA
ncbi:MAG: phosphoribosylanthranilate isomerase [Parvibaculales bacterium]